jgi:hypothetical protein
MLDWRIVPCWRFSWICRIMLSIDRSDRLESGVVRLSASLTTSSGVEQALRAHLCAEQVEDLVGQGAAVGYIGWAASPRSVARPNDQRGSGSRSQHGNSQNVPVAREFETLHWARVGFNAAAAVLMFVGFVKLYRREVVSQHAPAQTLSVTAKAGLSSRRLEESSAA